MHESPEVITRFLAYKKVIQARSPLTVKEYHRDLDMFFTYLVAKKHGIDESEVKDLYEVDGDFIRQVTANDIYSFLLYLSNERNDTSKTLARKLSAVKAFFKYHTTKSNIVENNPSKDIESPRIKQALPRVLSLDQSVELIDSVDRKEQFFERDYCIVTLFLNCGMRLAELVNINIGDIEDDMKKLRVTGKGNKMRTIYLNESCRESIKAYLPARNEFASKCSVPLSLDSSKALFLSKRNTRIARRTVQHLVYKYLEKAGLGGKGFSVHKLRHTAATLMYDEGGVDVRTLKDILGHEQLNTTQIYTHVSDKKMADAMESNPLAKKKRNK